MHMLAHISIGVRQLDRALRFYDAVLATLGYQRHYTYNEGAGYGPDRQHIGLWLNVYHRQDQRPHAPSSGSHVAFNADTRVAVDAFHAVALRNGGRDNGKPGLRTQYAPNYYGGFVFDPDGNHIEAVCFVSAPQPVSKPVEPPAAIAPTPSAKAKGPAVAKAPAKAKTKKAAPKAVAKTKSKPKTKAKSKPKAKKRK
jgi:catechol 2,3-dioxygenase-like lactoylglutathione lyase family enzyme